MSNHLRRGETRAEYNARRPSRAKGCGNPTYRLDALERQELAYLAHMDLWPKTILGEAFGVSRKTVNNCLGQWERMTA